MSEKLPIAAGVQKARECFGTGYNCAESTLRGLQVAYGIDDANLAQAATGFGAGIGGTQDVCGALTGGVVAASMAMGRLGGDPAEVRSRAIRVAKDAYQRFVQEFGGPDCRALTGFDFSEPGAYDEFRTSTVRTEKCPLMVSFVVETFATMEQERQDQEASKGS